MTDVKKILKPIAAIGVLLATALLAIRFITSHPGITSQLRHTSASTLVALFVLYALFIVTLGLVFHASLLLCKARLSRRESLLVTAYSSIINFFGPLQSGPAFRAVYLKKKHGISLKQYTVVSVVNYVLYAAISGLLIVSGVLGWWLLVLALAGMLVGYGLWCSRVPLAIKIRQLPLSGLGFMALAVLAQVFVMSLIFYVELHSSNQHVSYGQALIYTGAANFALFVSITPGAIGFREAFVLFTQHLHHIDNRTIVAASLLDRGMYIAVLLLVAVLLFGTHAHRKVRASAK